MEVFSENFLRKSGKNRQIHANSYSVLMLKTYFMEITIIGKGRITQNRLKILRGLYFRDKIVLHFRRIFNLFIFFINGMVFCDIQTKK